MTRRKITNAGEIILARRMTRMTGDPLMARLFMSNAAASDATMLAQLTPADWPSYVDFTLIDSLFLLPQTNADRKALVEYPDIVWTHDGVGSKVIYGVAIYESVSLLVVSIELYDAAITLQPTQSITFTPRLLAFDTADVAR